MTLGIQTNLFPDMVHTQVVNVASVPQRSPFRYPGGKTWLIPRIRQWFRSQPVRPAELIEPFAGGGIVSLTVAFEQLADRVLMVEKDENVSAVWETVLNGGNHRLAERIAGFDITPETVQAELAKNDVTLEERAFQTILRNRVNHGGILAPGCGLLKYGENGLGIKSRWYPETLRKRILAIGQVKERIDFIQGDGLKVLEDNAANEDTVYFIDPPYTAAGKRAGRRLYAHNELDHEALFEIVDSLVGDFLMTYDNSEGVEELARQHNFDIQTIVMKNTHHAKMTELLIGRDLDWVRT
ncbi:MAG: DNA adenine methylase [Stigonema ocellatum SAG 48.90 = DSM 106950]|nr:DNA adenine methylase [Stigonema ocellatum SAG 48.90 = DSM 106950]